MKKKEQIEFEKNILMLRAKELNSKLEPKNGKREFQILTLKGFGWNT